MRSSHAELSMRLLLVFLTPIALYMVLSALRSFIFGRASSIYAGPITPTALAAQRDLSTSTMASNSEIATFANGW